MKSFNEFVYNFLVYCLNLFEIANLTEKVFISNVSNELKNVIYQLKALDTSLDTE